MTSMQPMWWFALPLLLLPLWWHLQKRERTKTEPLATARFLPAAAPRQQRVFRFVDLLLLLIRLLLLGVLIAWLAVVVMPWKGDTVFIDPSLESDAWAAQQIRAAGMDAAAREPLPADLWNWLARNEHDWHSSARFLVVARALSMPALPPRLAHPLTLRTAAATAATAAAPAAAAGRRRAVGATDAAARGASAAGDVGRAAQPVERLVVVATAPERAARWQALFAAFSTAGDGAYRYVVQDAPAPNTELIVWDRPDSPPPQSWQAPLWWRTTAVGQAATRQGATWTAPSWPLTDPAAARTLYEQWQHQSKPTPAYPLPAIQHLPAQRTTSLPAKLAASPEWLAAALLALFALERIVAHVRRR